MRYGIAIPTFNRAETLIRSVSNYLAYMDDTTSLHIVDNGSTDETWSRIQQLQSTRIHTHRDPVDTHVKDGFLRALVDAAQHSDYTILMSDEDEIDWNVWPVFTEWIEHTEPSFVSTTFHHSEGFTRGNRAGTISPNQFFSASFYCSGLVYRSEDLLEAAEVIWPILHSNHFLKIYAEAGLVLPLFTTGRPLYWSDLRLAKQREQLDTHIVMDDGTRYWQPENRRTLAEDYGKLIEFLTSHYPKETKTWGQARNETLISSWRG